MKSILGIIFSLITALAAAIVAILLKKLSNKHVHFSVAIVYASYVGLPLTIALSLATHFTQLTNKSVEHYKDTTTILWQVSYALGSAVSGLMSQVFMNLSLKYEEASKVSLLRTTDLLFVFLLQYFLLDIFSNYYSIIGSMMIFVATLLVMLFKFVDQRMNNSFVISNNNRNDTKKNAVEESYLREGEEGEEHPVVGKEVVNDAGGIRVENRPTWRNILFYRI